MKPNYSAIWRMVYSPEAGGHGAAVHQPTPRHMDGWQDQPHAAEISAAEFEQLRTQARRDLGGSA